MQLLVHYEKTKEAILYGGPYIDSGNIVKKFTDCEKVVISSDRTNGYDSDRKHLFSLASPRTNIINL